MKVLEIPEVNLEDEELKLALATKLLEEGKISLGKAAEIGVSLKDLLRSFF